MQTKRRRGDNNGISRITVHHNNIRHNIRTQISKTHTDNTTFIDTGKSFDGNVKKGFLISASYCTDNIEMIFKKSIT